MTTKEYKEKANKRAGIEGVPSALRRGYNVEKMPVRGFLRSKMYFGFKILALNVKRLNKGLRYKEKTTWKESFNTESTRNSFQFRNILKILRFRLDTAA